MVDVWLGVQAEMRADDDVGRKRGGDGGDGLFGGADVDHPQARNRRDLLDVLGESAA